MKEQGIGNRELELGSRVRAAGKSDQGPGKSGWGTIRDL
jgi:hypothetical protein